MQHSEWTPMKIVNRVTRFIAGGRSHRGASSALAAIVTALGFSGGCVGTGPQAVRLTAPFAAAISDSDNGLDLTGLETQQQMPDRIDRRSAFDLVTAAAYLGTVSPGEAADQYVKLIKEHGRQYETAFARDAFQSALACAWDAGDPALIKRVLSTYDRSLDVIERAPEPKWIGELRGFFRVKDDMVIQRALERLLIGKTQTANPLLRRRADRWLDRHRAALVGLVMTFRDREPRNWSEDVLTDIAEAETNLQGGYVNEDSEILFCTRARRLLADTEQATSQSYIVAVAKLFLVKTGVVHQPDKTEFMLGNSYAARD